MPRLVLLQSVVGCSPDFGVTVAPMGISCRASHFSSQLGNSSPTAACIIPCSAVSQQGESFPVSSSLIFTCPVTTMCVYPQQYGIFIKYWGQPEGSSSLSYSESPPDVAATEAGKGVRGRSLYMKAGFQCMISTLSTEPSLWPLGTDH